uniref:Uncharacterized protein n=1 Tax=Lepeophtheirus salmonis TaxID=72036 RepID=A0A0K2THV3_LEPSM
MTLQNCFTCSADGILQQFVPCGYCGGLQVIDTTIGSHTKLPLQNGLYREVHSWEEGATCPFPKVFKSGLAL